MSSQTSAKKKKRSSNHHYQTSRRNPRTIQVDKDANSQIPAVIPEAFNLKSLRNVDIVGKIDDMRVLTKELSVMARQIEQWIGVAYTVASAFKDDGILKEVVRSLSAISNGEHQNANKGNDSKQQRERRGATPPPIPFPFFGQNQEPDTGDETNNQEEPTDKDGAPDFNIFEIISNPAFQEIVSKLLLQNNGKK